MIILPQKLYGTVKAPASKSFAHRLLILSALGEEKTEILCSEISKDISATIACLKALGADIKIEKEKIIVNPIKNSSENAELFCNESGSTLRFLLPLAGALRSTGCFFMEGRLSQRPLYPLDKALKLHGMKIEKRENQLFFGGKLSQGNYKIPGNISSQYISGLLMALPFLEKDSSLEITENIESEGYIKMTEAALKQAHLSFFKENNSYKIYGNQKAKLPSKIAIEGDWSLAAVFLCMGVLSEKGIFVEGLNTYSLQGDRVILEILKTMGAKISILENKILVQKEKLKGISIDASQIPDLIPPLAILCSLSEGKSRIINAKRLRLKESDRLHSLYLLINSLGGKADEGEDFLEITGIKQLKGGKVENFNDHRLSMSAALASLGSKNPIILEDSKSVEKSYPNFWKDFEKLHSF